MHTITILIDCANETCAEFIELSWLRPKCRHKSRHTSCVRRTKHVEFQNSDKIERVNMDVLPQSIPYTIATRLDDADGPR